jgi:hypothetical protein
MGTEQIVEGCGNHPERGWPRWSTLVKCGNRTTTELGNRNAGERGKLPPLIGDDPRPSPEINEDLINGYLDGTENN